MIVKEMEHGRRLMLLGSWPSSAGKKRPTLMLMPAYAGSSWRGKCVLLQLERLLHTPLSAEQMQRSLCKTH